MADIGNRTLFATGPTGTSGLDSLTVGGNSLWAQYGNGAKSDGTGGSSTIVQYELSGAVQNTYTIAGSDDGLKIDPATGTVFVLQNQDGNSTLMLIDPATGKITGPLSYAVPSTTRGYDDVVFENGQVYLSYTNPNGSGDAVIQRLDNGDMPFGTLSTSDILLEGATGTDISTGLAGQPIPLSDPDSLKSTPDGGLVLSSGSDNTLTFISHPGAANQSERFVTLKNLPAGSSLDDVVVPGSTAGTFYISNQRTNQIEAIKVSGLNTSDAYASVGTEIVKVDLQTGATTAILTGLSKSHGLTFVPDAVAVPVVQSIQILAVGSEVGGTKPDSITMAGDNVFVEYGNGADATGKPNGGSSTIVEYDKLGRTLQTYSLPGSLDGLKYNPVTGQVWALQNQDANSSLFIIDPTTQQVSTAFSYDSGYVYGGASTHGYDDVAFTDGKVYLSYTNPAAGDPVIELLDDGNSPVGTLMTTAILRFGDTGTNLTTGQVNQPLPVSDPDSLKVLPDGSLILTSDKDASYTIVSHPGTDQQSASFVTLPAGTSGLDDAIIPTTTSGTFLVANQNADDVLKVEVTGLNTQDIYASIGSENAVVQIDPKTGALVPIITGLNSPHGLAFIPSGSGNDTAAVLADAINLAQQSLPGSLINLNASQESGSQMSGYNVPAALPALFQSTDHGVILPQPSV